MAVVELSVGTEGGSEVRIACSGAGFIEQGRIEEAPAVGYEDWKCGAKRGVESAFRALEVPARRVTVKTIKGLSTDTSPATVGAAAALAVFDALAQEVPSSFLEALDELVFSGDLEVEFTL